MNRDDTFSSGVSPGDDRGRAKSFPLEIVPDPFLILLADGTIYDMNGRCEEMLNLKRSELIGRSYCQVDPLKIFCEKVPDAGVKRSELVSIVTLQNRHIEVSVLPYRTTEGTELLRIRFRDITNYVSLEKELLKRNRELIIINTLSGAFISSDNLDFVIENLLDKVLLVTDFSTGWLMVRDSKAFVLKTAKDLSSGMTGSAAREALHTLCVDIATMNEPIHVMEANDLLPHKILTDEGISLLIAVPLIYSNDIIGVLFLARKRNPGPGLNFDFASLLSLVGNHVSMILDKIRLFQETRRLSITDGLTGLFNSRYFYKQLDTEIARSNRYGYTFSLILFDIDNFKALNDTYGHQAGDDVLHGLAKILMSVSRETDIVVRYGGEEFIVVLPNTTEEDTINLADRIRTAIERHDFMMNHSGGVSVTVSGGIASYPRDASDARGLLYAADAAMYAAKTSGKNRIFCAGKSS